MGTVATGWHVAGEALRPGTTVSGQAVVAVVALFVLGALVGGLFFAAAASADRRRGLTRRSRSAATRADTWATEWLVLLVGWSIFHGLDLTLVTPGETPTLSTGARLLVGACGLVAVIVGYSLVESRRAGAQRRHDRREPQPRNDRTVAMVSISDTGLSSR